jgi:hypothetical protein
MVNIPTVAFRRTKLDSPESIYSPSSLAPSTHRFLPRFLDPNSRPTGDLSVSTMRRLRARPYELRPLHREKNWNAPRLLLGLCHSFIRCVFFKPFMRILINWSLKRSYLPETNLDMFGTVVLSSCNAVFSSIEIWNRTPSHLSRKHAGTKVK